ncbi:MAG: YicC family protein [Halanaerobiales bacterium]|nr:YicC family protein [Halanaerobiales bacterium]
MIKSMTGYGKAETTRDGFTVTAEFKTVNHRYSNIYLHTPSFLSALELSLNKMIKSKVSRGRIDLYLKVEDVITEGAYEPVINIELAKKYYNELKSLKESLDLNEDVTLDYLVSLPQVLKVKEAEKDTEVLHGIVLETVEKSLDFLLEMRTIEGEELYQDFIQCLVLIEKECHHIEEVAPKVIEEHKSKIRDRLQELLEDKVVDEYRLAMEIAILADKSSINEELVRLRSHIEQFHSNLTLEEPVGRKLDFIAQEMFREANTIGSKVIDSDMLNSVVNMKSEIDKIREQIQNIE